MNTRDREKKRREKKVVLIFSFVKKTRI